MSALHFSSSVPLGQAYETVILIILTDKFGMSQTFSGMIMALNNILTLLMLPFFGSLSDKRKSPHGWQVFVKQLNKQFNYFTASVT